MQTIITENYRADCSAQT